MVSGGGECWDAVENSRLTYIPAYHATRPSPEEKKRRRKKRENTYSSGTCLSMSEVRSKLVEEWVKDAHTLPSSMFWGSVSRRMSHANQQPSCDTLVISADRSGKVWPDLAESPGPKTGTRPIYQHQRDPDGETLPTSAQESLGKGSSLCLAVWTPGPRLRSSVFAIRVQLNPFSSTSKRWQQKSISSEWTIRVGARSNHVGVSDRVNKKAIRHHERRQRHETKTRPRQTTPVDTDQGKYFSQVLFSSTLI